MRFRIDIIIDWGKKQACLYVNDQWAAFDDFYYSEENIGDVNSVVMYVLSPGGTAKIQNLQICTDRCSGTVALFSRVLKLVFLFLYFPQNAGGDGIAFKSAWLAKGLSLATVGLVAITYLL